MSSATDVESDRRKLANFVDRRPHLETLHDAALTIYEDSLRIVAFHGFGGQGKSLLLRRFARSLTEPKFERVRHALVDFNESFGREAWLPIL